MQKLRSHYVLLLLVLTGCASPTPVVEVSFDPRVDALFPNQTEVQPIDQVHRLTEQQQQHFLAYFHNPIRATTPAHERVYDYLDNITNNFTYQESTFSAATTFDRRRGDCMSLAVLTTALADLVGVPVRYQLVDADPVYELAPNLAVRGVHVRSHLIDPDWQADPDLLMLRQPGLIVDYFPSGKERFIENLDAGEYAARYYINLAVEQLKQENLSHSYWLTITALQHDPSSADALNTLAVIYRRSGSYAKAEDVYQHAINLLPNKLSTLRNYELMLTSLDRTSDAAEVRSKLRRLNDPSPFSWYRGAREAFEQGDLRDAEYYYKKAIERAPYMPELRYGLAQVLAKQGNFELAQNEIEQSLENVWGSSNRQPYKAKLKWLMRQDSD